MADWIMPNYRRLYRPGGTYFFTVNLQERKNTDLLVQHIALLRGAVRKVRYKHPFHIHAWVVLPDHLHCVLELPQDDANYSLRWRLIKSTFSKSLPILESRSAVRKKRGERSIWQRRFWEHLIRDEKDYQAHVDYVHINPVKHGLVHRVADWPFSTFHQLVAKGVYPKDWAGSGLDAILPYED